MQDLNAQISYYTEQKTKLEERNSKDHSLDGMANIERGQTDIKEVMRERAERQNEQREERNRNRKKLRRKRNQGFSI